jgi:hypothetical protein
MVERPPQRSTRRSPALASRLFVAGAAVSATIAMIGWMGRSAGASAPTSATVTVRRVVVVEPQPEPVPYITLEAVLPGRTVTVVTQPPRVVHRAPGAAAPVSVPVVTTSSGS